MPSPAVFFRMFLFFVVMAFIFIGAVSLIGWIFGVKLNYWAKIKEFQKKKEKDYYEQKLKEFEKKEGVNASKSKSKR